MKVLIASGGSGGHIFPALSVASEIAKQNHKSQILIVSGKKDIERDILEKRGFNSVSISMKPFPRRFGFNSFRFLGQFIRSIFESLSIITDFKPDVVVGFGGYVSVPVVMAAFLSGIPTLIHEQNLKPGLANRLLKNFSKVIAVSFSKTSDYLGTKKVVVTGNPVRDDLIRLKKDAALEKFNLLKDKFTILVMGGSQGSHSINENFINALKDMEPRERLKMQIIHLAGLKDADFLRSVYKNLNINSEIFSFMDNISFAYSASDLVISRAGAASITEIMSFGLPSILIPYVYANAHQSDNAREFSSKGACLVFEENAELTEKISRSLKGFLSDKNSLYSISEKTKEFNGSDAANNIACSIIGLAKIKK